MLARRRYLLNALELLDLAIMLGAFGLAIVVPYYQIGRGLPLSRFLHMRVEVHNVFIFLGLATVWHLSFAAFVSTSPGGCRPAGENRDVVKATSVGLIFLAAPRSSYTSASDPRVPRDILACQHGLTVASRLAC